MTRSEAKPETLVQAARWQKVCRLAEGAGLCPACAAQFAWASQHGTGGFSSVHPPCAACTLVMLDWPIVRPNGWRKPEGDTGRADTWPKRHPTGRTASPAVDRGEV